MPACCPELRLTYPAYARLELRPRAEAERETTSTTDEKTKQLKNFLFDTEGKDFEARVFFYT